VVTEHVMHLTNVGVTMGTTIMIVAGTLVVE